MRPFVTFHDPWDALCLARALPGVAVATFGGAVQRAAFEAAGVPEPILVEPPEEMLRTLDLLDDVRVAEAVGVEPTGLLCFKPSARLEAKAAGLGARLVHAPARVGQGIENKLALAAIAQTADVLVPDPMKVTAGELGWNEITAQLGDDVVVQTARGHAGKTTWRVSDEAAWSEVCGRQSDRAVRVSRWIEGVAGTVGAVVDHRGVVLVTAPIVQVTGVPELTPHALGSCGNDFTWRDPRDPSEQTSRLAERLGPVLAERGYRGHFGLDFVFDGDRCWLIEINARLTASFGLYCWLQPRLLQAHLRALEEDSIEPGRLDPLVGGQLIATNTADERRPPISALGWWPHPSPTVGPAGRRGRRVVEEEVVATDGSIRLPLPPELRGSPPSSR